MNKLEALAQFGGREMVYPVKKYFNIILLVALPCALVAATNAVPKIVRQAKQTSVLALPISRSSASTSFQLDKLVGKAKSAWEAFKPPGTFIMSLARDGSGNVWAGTEGNGVWRYQGGNEEGRMQNAETEQDKSGNQSHLTMALSPSPSRTGSSGGEGKWKQFTTKNGLGDDYAYSVAVDKQGRIWVGHLNHGVSVYNGTRWRNYDIPNGPIGERIFKIAVCPTDGDVWLGTSAGLTRYSVSKDTWVHYTRNAEGRMQNAGFGQGTNESENRKAESGNHLAPAPSSVLRTPSPPVGEKDGLRGIPGDQITAIAFDKLGNIYVGTQCDGVAMASREADYADWRPAPMADQKLPTFAGFGLPSRLINDLLVAADGTVYAATDGGLAWSRDSGVTWQFRRGKDFADKMKGLAGGPPKGWSAKSIPKDVPPEDYVTCLAEDDAGVIWADFRQHGMLALSGYSYEELDKLSAKETGGADYGRAILPMPDFRPWLASYGKGLLRSAEPRRLRPRLVAQNEAAPLATDAPFPTPAMAPDLEELNGLLKELAAVPSARLPNGAVIPLEDDWLTEGQWTGRYGRFWIVLCGNWAPKSDVWGAGWEVMYDARMGLNHAPGDALRSWVHWLATKDNRCLEMSPTYLHSRVLKGVTTWDKDRRESEWDDHGEAYPMSKDGPHVYCSLSIPAGLFYLSLYEIDPNGHSTTARFRDYEISIRPHPGRASLDQQVGRTFIMRSFYDLEGFDDKPELAHARAHDFWGGVYKRFLVRGPTKLTIQVNRNYSFNTILPGVMLDLVDELPPPYYCTRQAWETKPSPVVAAQGVLAPAVTAAEAAQSLAAALAAMPNKNETWWAENKRRFYLPLLRWQLATGEKTNSLALATSYYQLNRFADWEKQLQQGGLVTAREIEKAQRWDGVTYSCAGMGYQMISEYVKAHPEKLGSRR